MGGAARTSSRINGPQRRRQPRRFAALCKICRLGIYDGDRRVWLQVPMGLSHEECARAPRNDRVQ